MDEESPIPFHNTPTNMSAHSAPSSVALPSVAGSLSPSVVSAPENTPTSCSPTPQLAICSQPIVNNGDDSVVNYNCSVVEEDEDTAPPGYLLNDPQSCHFYPIYLSNPHYSQHSRLRSYGLTARPGPLGRLGVPMITCCRLGDNNVTL